MCAERRTRSKQETHTDVGYSGHCKDTFLMCPGRKESDRMPYARKRQQARCRMCLAILYSRSPLPDTISALCTECAIINPGEAGLVFSRAQVLRRVA